MGQNVVTVCVFSGPSLIDVLSAMGYKESEIKQKFVQFEGLDKDPTGVPYGSSIATEKALDKNQCIIVAYEMNGWYLGIGRRTLGMVAVIMVKEGFHI